MLIAQVPPAVVAIAQRVHSQEQGAVTYRLRRVFDVHAGPMHRHDERTLEIASDGDTIVKVRVVQELIGGKAADAKQTAQLEDQYEHPNPGDVFHRPFDLRYMNEYTFETVDPQTYRFSSAVHDGSHGNGTFTVDSAGNVVKYEYTPYVLPQYTHSGTISDTRAQVLPNYWFVTQETQQYSGRYAIFGGGASVSITFDSFRRFANAGAAAASLGTPQK
jgi:hypothetical protein